MIALELISQDITPLNINDTCDVTFDLFDEYKVTHLPVCDENDMFQGMISENDAYDVERPDTPFSQLKRLLAPLYVEENDHVFKVISLMTSSNCSCIAVLTPKKRLLGTITADVLMKVIGDTALIGDIGGVLELEMNSFDYSLAEISRLVESNDARILGSYIRNVPDSKKIYVTLKINKPDLSGIIQTFQRYEYDISASYFENGTTDSLQDRYDNLLNYLNQ